MGVNKMIKTELDKSEVIAQLEITYKRPSNGLRVDIEFIDAGVRNKYDFQEMITPSFFNYQPTVDIENDIITVSFNISYIKPHRLKRSVKYILTYADIYFHGVFLGYTIAQDMEQEIKEMLDDTE